MGPTVPAVWVVAALCAASLEAGAAVTVDPSGSYSIRFSNPAWRFGGDVGAPVSNITVTNGSDGIGAFSQVTFDYAIDTARHASIRAYQDRPAAVFLLQYPAGGANIAPFPVISVYPNLPYHLTFAGIFATPSFPGFSDEGPWLLFDTSGAVVISPAANFLTARTAHGAAGEIVSGISSQIATLPAGFSHQTLIVAEDGVNRAFETWGRTLTDLAGKSRPANDAGPVLNSLGYWTDNGATYYYAAEPGLSYADTLAAARAEFAAKGVTLGYLQLDSWFYPKGAQAEWYDSAGGIYDYSAAAELFPNGLAAFQQEIGIPLATHARWIDASSPYRQLYQVSGNVAVDPMYWERVAGYLADSGVVTYEQDWLGADAHTDFNLSDPYAFLDNMARAMAARGLTMQYCMGTPGDFLQSTLYSNLTNARVSGDRFDRPHWDEFLYASRLASAVGVWPFSDVFMTTETDNLLLATLSAGPVGVGDRLGTVSGENLLRAARPDGVIVKPDAPVAPLDRSYRDDADGVDAPMIASTYTDFGGLRAEYVFAYARGANPAVSFQSGDLGIGGPAYLYDYFSDAGTVLAPGDVFSATLTARPGYYIVAPIGPSGIAMLGDRGQFVTLGKKRVVNLVDDGIVHATIAFAAGETVRTVFGYAPAAPSVLSRTGEVGPVNYDPVSHRFTVDVMPGAAGTASVEISL